MWPFEGGIFQAEELVRVKLHVFRDSVMSSKEASWLEKRKWSLEQSQGMKSQSLLKGKGRSCRFFSTIIRTLVFL